MLPAPAPAVPPAPVPGLSSWDRLAAGYTSGRTRVGLWRIGRDGSVLRRPDRQVPPPGRYPSPYYAGLLQRWEGPGWTPLPRGWWHHAHRYFRAPDRPFL